MHVQASQDNEEKQQALDSLRSELAVSSISMRLCVSNARFIIICLCVHT